MERNACHRYRAWYVRLLRLYPRAFRELYAEPMAQTFHDLCRERAGGRRALFVLWMVCETLAGICRERAFHMAGFVAELGTAIRQLAPRVALGALAVWMIPVVAAQFVPDWHWGLGGFAFVYFLFFLTGMGIALVARKMGVWSYKAGVGLAVVAGFVLGWSTWVQAASLENPSNFWYDTVLVIGLIGAVLVRLKAPGLSWTLFAMAAVLAVISLTLPSGAPPDMTRRMAIGHAVQTVMFAASGLLFRHASSAAALE